MTSRPRLSFFFNAQIDFFEEIAKYRAARRIWARELRETFGARKPESWRMRFHTQTAGVSLTAQQPLNNIVRTAIEALAGVLGGTQSLHTNSYDEALALPTEEAVRIALRTQQIIAEETGVTNTIDPLGGAYFVEALTDRMEELGLRVLRQDRRARRDGRGGQAAASRSARSPTPRSSSRREIDSGRRTVVGVNRFTEGEEHATRDPAHRPRARAQADRARPRGPRPSATTTAVERVPDRRSRRPRPSDRNLMPLLIDAARAGASEGEIVAGAPVGLGRLPRAAGLLAPASSPPRPRPGPLWSAHRPGRTPRSTARRR